MLAFGQQSKAPLRDLSELVVIESPYHHTYTNYFRDCSNELKFMFTALFVGYKNFFSSQDGQHCTFSPSCSVYAIETVKKKGILEGFMDTMDRLTRCNGLSPGDYTYDAEQHLLIDKP